MPREAPRVQPYTVTMLPSGSINSRQALASDFGGDLGLGRVGQGLANVGEEINQVQQDQSRIWASTAIAQAELQARQQMEQHVNGLDPTAPDYPDQIGKLTSTADDMWSTTAADLQSKAPTAVARRMVAAQMSRAGVRFTADAMTEQSRLNAGYTTKMVQDGVKASSDLLAVAPDNSTYARLVQQSHESIVGLNTIAPDVKLKLAEQSEHQLAVVQAQSFASQYPADFLRSVNAQGGITTRSGTKGKVPTLPGSAPETAGFQDTNRFLSALPAETQGYVPSVLRRLGSAAPTTADGKATPALVQAVIGQESNGIPTAESGKGARGLMQVMPATAASIGMADADLWDPAQNKKVGTEYLNQQLKKYDGDVAKALAAYNAGPGAVDRALAGTGGQVAPLPQVQPLTDQQIAAAVPPLAGWGKLTWGEKVAAVRQAEGLLGKHLADDRGATGSALQDAMAAVSHGLAPRNLDDPRFSLEHLQSLYGVEEGQRKRTELDGLVETAQAIKGLATMPDAQAASTIETLKTNAAGTGAAVLAPAVDRVERAYAAVSKQRKEHPLQAAEAYGLGGYADLDWSSPDKMQAGLSGRVATARTMMQEFGAVPQVFNQQDVAQAQTALTKLAPADRVDYLKGIVEGIQDPQLARVALHQVYPKGDATMMTAVRLAQTAGNVVLPDGTPTSNRETANMVAEGYLLLHPDGGIGKPVPTAEGNPAGASVPVGRGVLPLDTAKFNAAFAKAVGGPAAFAGPDANFAGRMAQETYDAVKAYYVADAMHNRADVGAPDAKDVARAVTAVTGGVWKRGKDALFAPQGMPMQQFQDQFAGRAVQAFKAAGFESNKAEWQFDHTDAVNVGDGKYAFMLGGRPVVSPTTGAVIVVDYSQGYTPPAAAAGVQVDPRNAERAQQLRWR